MAEQELVRAPHQASDDGVVGAVDDDQPRRGRALLAGVPEGRVGRGGDGLIRVGVVVDDEGVLAAQLADDLLDVALPGLGDGGDLVEVEPDRLGAGERDDRHIGVLHQASAHVLSEAGQELEDAGCRPRRHERLGQPPRHRRRLLGRLQDHRVAGRQGRHGHPAGDGEREVPGRDHGRDALALVGEPVGLARG